MNAAELQDLLQEMVEAFTQGPDLPKTPAQINNGWCADFAQAVVEKANCPELQVFNDEELGAEEYTHTFLKLNDLFYDAECIEGEEDWTQLPVFQRPDQLCEKCHRIVAEYSHQSGELCEDCWQNVNE